MADFMNASTECYVDSIEEAGKYGQKFVVRNYKTDPSEVKYPWVLGIEASSKRVELLRGIEPNDKIEIEIMITGSKGVSQKTGKPYQINKLMISKLRLIEKHEAPANEEIDDDQIPF